ncbi:PGPGW domain-containing protein [uncultured Friedmanniella sp.]|uniref:PGPGW domain-containing protein n=1 Tax=uncultured Friedmanniella sp. TaxID=335381 RepID=UPI0035CA5982
MSPDVEQPRSGDRTDSPVLEAPVAEGDPVGTHPDRHVLREAGEDRWKWRARIRRNAHQLRVYRVAVAILGALLIGLGLATGWLPGPGGIPLVLLGLAVWASEFVWAQRLMELFKRQLRRFRSWTRPQQAAAWIVFFACCGLIGYGYLVAVGAPTWLPGDVTSVLARLPGV